MIQKQRRHHHSRYHPPLLLLLTADNFHTGGTVTMTTTTTTSTTNTSTRRITTNMKFTMVMIIMLKMMMIMMIRRTTLPTVVLAYTGHRPSSILPHHQQQQQPQQQSVSSRWFLRPSSLPKSYPSPFFSRVPSSSSLLLFISQPQAQTPPSFSISRIQSVWNRRRIERQQRHPSPLSPHHPNNHNIDHEAAPVRMATLRHRMSIFLSRIRRPLTTTATAAAVVNTRTRSATTTPHQQRLRTMIGSVVLLTLAGGSRLFSPGAYAAMVGIGGGGSSSSSSSTAVAVPLERYVADSFWLCFLSPVQNVEQTVDCSFLSHKTL